MAKRRTAILLLIVFLVAGGAAAIYFSSRPAAAQSPEEPAAQTATVRRGELVVSATGAGTVVPAQEVELSFASSGVLTELAVRVGDRVAAGDVLARVDDGDAQNAAADAQLRLSQAAMQTDAASTQAGISFDEIGIAQAQINLDQAQLALDELRDWQPDEAEIALLEAKLAAAEVAYNAARGQEAASGTDISIRRINLDQARRDLASAQEAYDTAWDAARDWELNDPMRSRALESERDRTAEGLQRAQEAVQVAELNYNAAVASTNSSSSSNAETNLLSAQQALDAARLGPTETELRDAEIKVRQAELSLQQALLNKEANALSLAEAELNLASAEAALEATTLVAPVDGTVTAINAAVGENAGNGVIVLADLVQSLLEIFLDETDLNMVGLDYEVEVIFDALPEQTFTGRVVQVDPQLVAQSGVSVVRALVQLDGGSFAKPQTLPVGLNATVEVIGGRARNALLVPVEALRELAPGDYAVFVMENGTPRLRQVEVGLMDFTYAEIVSGLDAGDVVTTGIVETE